ncbi:MAG: MATE family efflux transporter [Oscillospiraceae bacterium]|nr:MATE family efflux transporter [Oscillospiraceae bacterium]
MSKTIAGSKFSMDMCTGSIWKKMIIFTLPLMLSGILQLLFNAADVIVVGKFAGDASLAAVGSTASIVNLMTNLFIGMSVGTNVLVANYFAADQKRDLHETVHTSMLLSVIGGVFLTVVGIVSAPYILSIMKTPDDVIGLSSVYLRTYFCGMTSVMIYNFGSAILRAIGDTRRPLIYLSVAGVFNVVLNLIFVIAFHMGVFGVGLATVISQTISALLILRCLIKENSDIRLEIRKIKIHSHKLLRIMQIGIPAGIQGMMFSLSNMVIQSSVNSFGTTVVAANSASISVEGFAYTSMNSFHQAAVSFTGQNAGARKYDRINKILGVGICYVFLVGMIFCAVFILFGSDLIGLYSKSDMVTQTGVRRLTIIACSYFLCGMMDVTVGCLRGLGYSFVPTLVSLLGVCVLRVVWIMTVFQLPQYHVVETIYYSYPLSWAVTFCAHLLCFAVAKQRIRKKWLTPNE